jgi:acetyltransferase-like isoleucine patch superfamily enzyme
MKYLRNKKFWRAFITSLFFNFKNLPFNQARKLPIWVYKMRCISQKGEIVIDSDNVHTGMIQLGFPRAATYPNTGITWRNKGKVIFKGKCKIGNDCYLIVGKQGVLTIGDDFKANAGIKIVSECRITFGKSARVGWSVTIMDTNFHPLYDMEKKQFKKAFGPIVIGDYNWFATQCYIMHGVQTPERCIFGARSMITRGGKYESYCVHGGSPIHVISRNVMWDYGHEQITDYSLSE